MLLPQAWLLCAVAVTFVGCTRDIPPKRLMAYLPQLDADARAGSPADLADLRDPVTAILIVCNDTGFPRSAPPLRKGTLVHLGDYLSMELRKQAPLEWSSMVYPDRVTPEEAAVSFVQLGKTNQVPYVVVALLSSAEWEVFDRLPLNGLQGSTGMRSAGLPGYRVENYARLELALLNVRTGRQLISTGGQAWAVLERLEVPLSSNLYPVVRRDVTQPPIYPNAEGEADETLRWVSGRDAIAQAAMHFGEWWTSR